jgi:hypothetical protein
MRKLILTALILASGNSLCAQPSDQINKAIELLAADGGRYGIFLNQAIKDQIKSGKLGVVYTKQKGTEGKTLLGTIGTQDRKLLIKVSPDQSTEELALTIGHEYMHWSTQTYLDQMEQLHPELCSSILRGSNLTDSLSNNPDKTFSREELHDVFTYVMFHFIDEVNAYLFEQKLAGKRLRPKQWADAELATHIWEQQIGFNFPSVTAMLGLKAVAAVKKDMPPAETLLALITDENFEQYMQANRKSLSGQSGMVVNRRYRANSIPAAGAVR